MSQALRVRVVGVEQATKRLAEINKSVDPVLRGALNTTATKTRAEQYAKPLKNVIKSGGGQPLINSRLKVKRANRRFMNSRIIPSGAGIEATAYRNWGYNPVDKTRGQIWVGGVGGARKLAAGFVNPSSKKKLPWQTRSEKRTANKTYSYGREIQEALAPSTAYWFKQMTTPSTLNWVNTFLQQEFAKRMNKELAK